MVGADGGVFDFGSASFHGSAAGRSLAALILGTATTAHGGGYWLIGRDGPAYPYGDARYFGQVSAVHLAAPIT